MLIQIKYIIVVVMIFIVDLFLFNLIERSAKEGVEYEKELLINQARAHFNDQVNTRSWNAQYGGIYVYPQENQKPNPYLLNNSIKDEDNKTMIKINPAWMTRQLSELAKIDGYHFRITSLNPLNPNNQPNAFEKKALKYILESDKREYFEFDSNEKRFQYMGALVTKAACLSCHQHQGYRVGDIRGGISVTLGSDKHFESRIAIAKRQNWQKIFVIIVSLVLGVLIIHTLRHAKILQKRVEERTKEINQTKLLLQAVLDAELSFLVVTDEHNIIYVNQTLLNFFGYSSIEEFEDNKIDITKRFEYIDGNDQPQNIARNHNWIEHLLKHHNTSDIKVLIKKGRQNRFFKPHAKEICVEHKKLFLVILNEITQDLNEKRALESIASTDALTGLANRSKFDQVIEQQIELAQTTDKPLTLLFVDIDHFKKVNDTYGHNVGDEVLKALGVILNQTLRTNDFIARWGGEEFIVMLPSTNIENAIKVANKIRENVRSYQFKHGEVLTISCGVTEYQQNEEALSFIQRADQALYQAKNSGRDRVEAL